MVGRERAYDTKNGRKKKLKDDEGMCEWIRATTSARRGGTDQMKMEGTRRRLLKDDELK
jgi:hypothetical protein